MPLIKKKLAAGTAGTFFPLQGSQYEYLPFNALIEFAIVQIGGAADWEATVYSGSDVLQEQSSVDVKSSLQAIYPDDFMLSDVAAAGERLGVQMLSGGGTGGNDDALVVVRITPL